MRSLSGKNCEADSKAICKNVYVKESTVVPNSKADPGLCFLGNHKVRGMNACHSLPGILVVVLRTGPVSLCKSATAVPDVISSQKI